MKRVALIGLGPHAKRIYYPQLETMATEDDEISFELLIDLEMNREIIEAFLKQQRFLPKHTLYLSSDDQITPKTISAEALDALKNYEISKAILATEPKAHKVYLEACIELGIQVVTDKPVTAPVNPVNSTEAADEIFNDIVELSRAVDEHESARVLVQCQRRNHVGYRKVMDTLKDLVGTYKVPITFISIHHSDGMWNMPDEYLSRENHPYKYGYGKLMHSGYHFADLLTSLLKINNILDGKLADTAQLFSQYSRPDDQHLVINQENYARFFGAEQAKKFAAAMKHETVVDLGEVDSYSQLQLTKNGKVITTAQMSLIQSGFSQRAWPDLPEDTYKSNGRIRHESLNVHVGPLASIQIHSYQSRQISEQSVEDFETGGNNHFDIYIFRNSNLIGGQAFEKIQFGADDVISHSTGSYLGHNENARQQTLKELMYDLPSNSELRDHFATNKLLAEIYKNHARQSSGKIPVSTFNAKDIL